MNAYNSLYRDEYMANPLQHIVYVSSAISALNDNDIGKI